MGKVTLMKRPNPALFDHPSLMQALGMGVFEEYLEGITLYIAHRYAETVYDYHAKNFSERFFEVDEQQLQALFKGSIDAEHWHDTLDAMHDMATSGAITDVLTYYSLASPAHLLEQNYAESIVASFMMHYTCLGGDPAFMHEVHPFSADDKVAFADAMSVLKITLHEAFNELDKVMDFQMQYTNTFWEDAHG